jgi:hypothetical protein
MSGVTRQAKPAVARPLDGGVRHRLYSKKCEGHVKGGLASDEEGGPAKRLIDKRSILPVFIDRAACLAPEHDSRICVFDRYLGDGFFAATDHFASASNGQHELGSVRLKNDAQGVG